MSKNNTKSKASKKTSTQRRRAKRTRKARPETPVSRVLGRLEIGELEARVTDTYRELVDRLQDRTHSTRERVEQQLETILERAQGSRAGEAIGELEERMATELDEVLEKLGLIRTVKLDELIAKAEKRGVSRERRRQKKARAAAAAAE